MFEYFDSMYGDNSLEHAGTGKEKAGHKYQSRYWKNGRWNYVYSTLKNNKMQRRLDGKSLEDGKVKKTDDNVSTKERYKRQYTTRLVGGNKSGFQSLSSDKPSAYDEILNNPRYFKLTDDVKNYYDATHRRWRYGDKRYGKHKVEN